MTGPAPAPATPPGSPSPPAPRQGTVSRDTRETRIRLRLALDGTGAATLATGVGFFDHMLEQVARHGLVDLDVAAQGDTHIDDHHTVEDVGIAFGLALAEALGPKRGVRRFGHAYCPLDEALSRAVVDLSGRPGLVFEARFTQARIGTFDTELVREFFQAVANNARVTLHLDCLRGVNAHHQAETLFKAFGRAMRMAVEPDPRAADATPSTKGVL